MIINTTLIIFKINNKQSIIIKNLCYEGNHLYRWDPVDIIFKNKSLEYIISQHDYLMPKIEDIYYYLQSAIKNKLPVLKSMKGKLGYFRNQGLHQENTASCEKPIDKEKWKTPIYIMWGGNKFNTWLYNQNNKIFLEITPCYPWHFNEPKAGDNYVPYDEWIKSYKPLIIIEIDKVTAQQWYDQAGKIMQEIEKNDEKYLHTPQE